MKKLYKKMAQRPILMALLPVLFFLLFTLPSLTERRVLRQQVEILKKEWRLYAVSLKRLANKQEPAGKVSLPLVAWVEEAAAKLGLEGKVTFLRPVGNDVELELNEVSLPQALSLLESVEVMPSGGTVSSLKLEPADAAAQLFRVRALLAGS